MSGGKKDASAVSVAHQSISYSAVGYDLLLVEVSVAVTCGSGAMGGVKISGAIPFVNSGEGAKKIRILFARDCGGRFVSQPDRTGYLPTATETQVDLTLMAGGDGTTVWATGSIRVYGIKFNV